MDRCRYRASLFLLFVFPVLATFGCGKPTIQKVCEKHYDDDDDCVDELAEWLPHCDDDGEALSCAMEACTLARKCFESLVILKSPWAYVIAQPVAARSPSRVHLLTWSWRILTS